MLAGVLLAAVISEGANGDKDLCAPQQKHHAKLDPAHVSVAAHSDSRAHDEKVKPPVGRCL